METKPNLTLYIGTTCPYCSKVTSFMLLNNISIPIVDVWTDENELKLMQKLTGKKQVPCLKIDDSYLLESDDIIKKLRELYL